MTSPSKATTLSWQEIAFKKMGIQPGICKCCGGEMLIIQTFTNRFLPKHARAPPEMLNNEIQIIAYQIVKRIQLS